MPRELITIQVGQCGNQIGHRFWDMALREHAAYNRGAVFDEALSSFFRNVDTRSEPPKDLPVGDGKGHIRTLKARAVLVDMEEGVVSEMMKGPLRDVFDTRQLLTDTSGAGNNWAHGFHDYGPRYREALIETIRRPAEMCESLQSFLLLHSLGGGTGSGVGSYILEMLADEFPEVYRFTASIFPSEDDDVVTSPYNSVLSAAKLADHADCVLPIENQALMDICERVDKRSEKSPGKADTAVTGPEGGVAAAGGGGRSGGTGGGKPFDRMNGIAANLLLHLTSSVRYEGSLNTDLNDITMNLVPYPRLHFLLGSLAPLQVSADVGRMAAAPRAVDHVFSDVFSREHQVVKADPRNSTYLACALLCRGEVTLGDINRNIARLKPSMRMVHWNPEGFKVGICAKPPVGVPYSVLGLSNSCCIRQTLDNMRGRFGRLYQRKFYLHHYEQYMEAEGFDAADGCLADLSAEYEEQDRARPPAAAPRLRPVGVGFA